MLCSYCQKPNEENAEACFGCGRSLHALTQGMVLGERYVIHRPLGRGGMGHVYQAQDRILEEDVAIKVIRGDYSRDTELARRFRSEIRLARRISHRNVCRIHEYGEDAGIRYLCMEFVDGVDLKRLLKDGGLSSGDAFAIGIQAAEGLEAVHALGIIHRDLKPSNLMVDHRGVVRLMDFGIAKEIESEGGLTGSGDILGTPEYMSPEQAQGLPVGYSSDVYALGCVIYECFAGRPPFRADTPVNTLYMHVHEPPSFGPAVDSMPASVVPLLRKALAKAPEERPSASELAAALRAARAAQGTTADNLAALAAGIAPPWATSSTANPSRTSDRRGESAGPLSPVPVTTTLGRPPDRSYSRTTLRHTRRWRWGFALLGTASLALLAAGLRPGGSPPLEEPPAQATPPLSTLVSRPTPEPTATSAPAAASRPIPTPTPRAQGARAIASPAVTALAAEPPIPGPTSPPVAAGVSTTPPSEPSGTLTLVIVPPAQVTLDGTSLGTVSHHEVRVSPGRHVLGILHPDYKPLQRVLNVTAGGRPRVVIDLAEKGVRQTPGEVR